MKIPTGFVVFPLRYYPNLATGEFLNVGVGLVASESGWWGIRVARSFRGFSRVFPTAQPKALRSTLAKIERAAQKTAPKPNTLFSLQGGEWRHPRQPLEVLVSGNRGALRWGEPLVEGATQDLQAELDHWYAEFVPIRREEVEQPALDAEAHLSDTLRDEFDRRGLLTKLRPADIGTYHKRRFPYTHRNGALNVFDSINLDFRSRQTILDRGQLWRGSLDIIGEAEPKMAFYALVRLPRKKDLLGDAEVALTMIARAHSVKVETFSADKVEDLGFAASQLISTESDA